MAYKSLDDIIDVIKDSVDIMKPVYNFKASECDVPWKKLNEIFLKELEG